MSIQAQNTELNIVPGGIIPVVHVSQYDVDRVLTFKLYDRNSEASLASGTTAVIEGTKPDGNGFQYAATISGNTVTVNTTIQMTVLSGTVDCKIVLRNGSQVIGTALFIMDVEKAGINENTPMSETDLPLIIAEATEQMERAEAEALKAEGYATGKQNGEDVSSESPYYHNNAEYYSEYAESIADRLPEGLSPKGTCVFADLPSISESIVGDMWVISDSFITTSDFRGGSGVSVPSGAYVYLTDSNKWDILPSKSGGHTILNESGTELPQRSKLQFNGAIVSDDETNDATVVETVNPVEYEEDIYGVNLIPYPYIDTTKTQEGITFTDNGNGSITANANDATTGPAGFYLWRGYEDILPKGEYILSDSGESSDNIYVAINKINVSGAFVDVLTRLSANTHEVKFNVDYNGYYFASIMIFAKSGSTASNLVFHPMLRKATIKDDTYRPFNQQSIQHQLTDQTNVLSAKNLIPYPYDNTTKTKNGITFTDNGDGTITVNGTSTAATSFQFEKMTGAKWIERYGENVNLTLSGCPSGGGSSRYALRFEKGSPWQVLKDDIGNGVTFNTSIIQSSDANYTILFTMSDGQTFNNVIIKPMLRLASDPDNTYVPYAMTNKEITDAMADSGWQTCTLATGFSGNVKYRQIGKVVMVTGMDVIATATGSKQALVQTLPTASMSAFAVAEKNGGVSTNSVYIDTNTAILKTHVVTASEKYWFSLIYFTA